MKISVNFRYTCSSVSYISNIFIHVSSVLSLCVDARAGGAAAPNLAKVTKHKMQNDEALKILNIEGRKNINSEVLLQVRQ